MNYDQSNLIYLIPLFALLIIWESVWKGFGLWQSARNRQLKWFIAICILNTVGLLPIIYLKFFQKKQTDKDDKESDKITG